MICHNWEVCALCSDPVEGDLGSGDSSSGGAGRGGGTCGRSAGLDFLLTNSPHDPLPRGSSFARTQIKRYLLLG